MRIALVSREYPPETAKGGLATQTALKARALASFGHQVHVISEALDGEPRSCSTNGVQVTRIAGYHHRLVMWSPVVEWMTYSAHVAVALQELGRPVPFDIVEFPEWGCEGLVPLLNRDGTRGSAMIIQLHAPLVMLAHTLNWPPIDSEFYRVGTALEAATLRLADAVYSSSACSTDWCARHYGLRRDDVPTLHAGVDTNLFAPRAEGRAACPTIAYAGRLVWNKGVDMVVEAACRLVTEHPVLQLVLCGAGDAAMVDAIRSRAAAAGFADAIEITGQLGHEALARCLARAHAFAAPSIYEPGPGLACLEAMACGLPVVASDGSGFAEVVSHGETGFLVPPRDVDALTEALGRLLAKPADAEAMGRRARAWVIANADTQRSVRRIETFYERAVQRLAGAPC
jgi:glycogen(starch) synthase